MVYENRLKNFKGDIQMISIIIPTLNEEENIADCIKGFLDQACEVIVVDAQSQDNTLNIARQLNVKIIESKIKNRAHQMNLGAKAAQGDILLFFHADSRISDYALDSIKKILNNKKYIGGGFTLRFFPKNPFNLFQSGFANVFCRLTGLLFGDRGIFIRKDSFIELGGFPEVKIMEDAAFSDKMRKNGKIIILPEIVKTSARKYANETKFQALYRTMWAYIAYKIGVSPETIYKGYYNIKEKDNSN